SVSVNLNGKSLPPPPVRYHAPRLHGKPHLFQWSPAIPLRASLLMRFPHASPARSNHRSTRCRLLGAALAMHVAMPGFTILCLAPSLVSHHRTSSSDGAETMT